VSRKAEKGDDKGDDKSDDDGGSRETAKKMMKRKAKAGKGDDKADDDTGDGEPAKKKVSAAHSGWTLHGSRICAKKILFED
jgi:hypothetical protein